MAFNNFRINFIVRIVLLTATIFVFSYLWINTDLTMTLMLIGLVIVFQIASEKSNLAVGSCGAGFCSIAKSN